MRNAHYYLYENVRPMVIRNAVKILRDSPAYKFAKIKVDENRFLDDVSKYQLPSDILSNEPNLNRL